jgi:hypothetical protein
MKSICLTLPIALLAALVTLAQPLPPLVRQAAPGVYYRLSEDDKKIIAQIFTTIDFTKYKPWSDNDTRNRNAVNAMYEKLK